MVGVINLFLPLLVQVLILYFLSLQVNRMVLRYLGKGWYLATMWPGVMIHELSHLVGCLITFTRVYQIRLFSPAGNSLGFVEHARTRNPVKNVVISIAPLFGGTAVILLLVKFLFPDLFNSQLGSISAALTDFTSFESFFNFTREYFGQYWYYLKDLISSLDFSSWPTYVFIYLMLTISSHIAPSKQDLKFTYGGLAGLMVIFVLIYFVDKWLHTPIVWTAIKWLTAPVFFAANFLTYGIIFAGISFIVVFIISLPLRLIKRG